MSGRAPLDLDATQHPLLEPVAHFGMKVGTAGNNDPARQKTPSTGTVFLTNKRRKFIYEWVREGFTVPRFEYGETNRLILHKPGVDHLSIGVLTDSDRERFDALAVLVLHFVQTVANPEMVREVVL